MSFILFAGGMLLVALLLILIPLKRGRGRLGVSGFALAVTLLVVAAALYINIGFWPAVVEVPQVGDAQPEIEQMVEGLAAKLLREPENVPAWLMLGRSYVALGQYDKAELAYGHALRHSEFNNPDALAGYAEAMTLNQRRITDTAAMLLEKALQLAPDNPKALWYGGIAAQQRGDFTLAVERFQILLAANPPAELRSILESHLAEVQQARGQPAQPVATDNTPFSLHVSLAPALRAQLPADAVLFLYVRVPGQGGPPLAVKRLVPATWPVETTLGQENIMLPGTDLSAADRLLFGALISRDGSAQRAAGDWYGETEVAAAVAGPIRLEIDTLVP